MLTYCCAFKKPAITLAGVAQWIEHWIAKRRVTGLIASQGTCLGFGPGPQQGAHKRQSCIDVSLPLFSLPSPVSKNKQIKSLKKRPLIETMSKNRQIKKQLTIILGDTLSLICTKLMTRTHTQQNRYITWFPSVGIGCASSFTNYKGTFMILTSEDDGRICHLKI